MDLLGLAVYTAGSHSDNEQLLQTSVHLRFL